jgi:WD40 repeat protein
LVPDPQDRWLASVSEDATIRIWDWPSGQLRHRLRGEDAFYDAVFTSKNRLFSCDGGGRLHCFDADSGRRLDCWNSHEDPIYALALYPNGSLLAAAGGEHDPVVRLWSLPQPRMVRTLKGHTHAIYGLAFSSDGRFLASASADGTVRLWDPIEGRLLKTFTHPNYVYRCRFAPGHPLLATACHDKCLRLWHARTGECVATFNDARGPLFTTTFTADGLHLLAAGEDRSVRIYEVSHRRLMATIPVAKDVLYALVLLPERCPIIAAAGGDAHIHLIPWPESTAFNR